MASSYTTLENIQRELRADTSFGSTTVPSGDTVIQWIEEESEQINLDAGYSFDSQIITDEYIDYDGQQYLLLQNAPIQVGTVVLEYNRAAIGQTEDWVTLTEGDDFIVYERSGEILLIRPFEVRHCGIRRFRVAYTSGHIDTPVVVTKLATKMVASRVLNTILQQNIDQGNTGGTIKVGSITIVEPTDVSVGTYKSLQEDIQRLREQVSLSSGRVRY